MISMKETIQILINDLFIMDYTGNKKKPECHFCIMSARRNIQLDLNIVLTKDSALNS